MILSWRSPFRFFRALTRALWYKLSGRDIFASMAVQERRLDTCATCPHLYRGQCGICTCYVGVMTMIASKECPDKPPRWKAV